MRRRILELSLFAYPRLIRQRDGEQLLDLALDLADVHGAAREAFGLLRGGLAERRRRRSPARRAVIAASAALGSVLVVLTWTAAAEPMRVEEDRYSCAGECSDVGAEVAEREADGWICTESRSSTTASWRCVRD